MRTSFGKTWRAALIGLSCASLACDGELNNIVCIIEAFEMGQPVSVGEAQSQRVTFLYQRSDDQCEGVVSTVESADPATAAVSEVSFGNAGNNSVPLAAGMRLEAVTFTLSGVKPGGPVQLRLRVTATGTPAQERSSTAFVFATKGIVNVNITGLPSGVAADTWIGSVIAPLHRFTVSGTTPRMDPNTYPFHARSVVANGVTYDPTPVQGSVVVSAAQPATVNIVYSVRVATTGVANIQVAGLPGGTNGNVTITGNGVNQTVTSSGNVTLDPGTYTVSAGTVPTTNNDYGASGTQQITITAGQTTNVTVTYAIVATVVNVGIGGLEIGVSPLVTLTNGSDVRTITVNVSQHRLPVGTWTIVVTDRTLQDKTYSGRSDNPPTLVVAAAAGPQPLGLMYYLRKREFTTTGNVSVLLDPFGHNPFIALLLGAHPMDIFWEFPQPPAPGAAILANQVVTQETVRIRGTGAFVTVTGTRAANGSITLTGSGTVAGFPNVPVQLTGTLTAAGALTGGQYRMGQDTPPTGLPNGSITYAITAPAPAASGVAVQEAAKKAPRW